MTILNVKAKDPKKHSSIGNRWNVKIKQNLRDLHWLKFNNPASKVFHPFLPKESSIIACTEKPLGC